MSDLPTILTAAGVSLPTLGAGIAFLWNKLEKRFATIERKLEECQQREDRQKQRGSVHLIVIELLWQEVTRLTGISQNPTLNRAKSLLDGLKKDPPPDDPALDALARKLGED